LVTYKPIRANKKIVESKLDTIKINITSTHDKLLVFFQENKGKYFSIGEILSMANVQSGGHSSQSLKNFIYKGLLKVRECECHQSKMYIMPNIQDV
jgi:hypothetical protein